MECLLGRKKQRDETRGKSGGETGVSLVRVTPWPLRVFECGEQDGKEVRDLRQFARSTDTPVLEIG